KRYEPEGAGDNLISPHRMKVAEPRSQAEPVMAMAPVQILDAVEQALPPDCFKNQRVLTIVPDGTRTAPIGDIFKALHGFVAANARAFDVLIALGTHQPMTEAAICKRLDIQAEERGSKYGRVRFFNHTWDQPQSLVRVGTLPENEIKDLTHGRFAMEVQVDVNRMLFDYDQIIIIGPVFPHEVVGFSGGNKYLFPGVGGPAILNFFHWLGAVVTNPMIIGNKWTPVRRVVDR